MTDIVERLRREANRFAAMDDAAERPWVADAAWAADHFSAAADEIERLRAEVHILSTSCGHCGDLERAWAEAERLRADLLKAEMRAEIAGLEGVMRGIAVGRREGIDAAIVACGGVFTDDKGAWAHGFTRGVTEAQASVRALLEDAR